MRMSSLETKKVDSSWVRYRAIAYLKGRGLSFGAGPDPIVPKHSLDQGKYSLNFDVVRGPGVDAVDQDLSVIAARSLDHIFIGPRVDEVGPPEELLASLVSKLREGGHLVVHRLRPKPLDVAKLGLWQAKDSYLREGQSLAIYKLVGASQRGLRPQVPATGKRVCIARYGAIGDMIILSPLIKQLTLDGYAVTLNITPYCAEVIKHNPYVSNVIIQERDAIPNGDLGHYWKEWADDYDKYINLSESIEGKLLRVEGRRDFYTSKDWRVATTGGVNYFDQTMRLGGYPDLCGTRGEIYFTRSEEKEAAHIREIYRDKFLVLWGLKGSSHHKQYPLLQPVLTEWLGRRSDAWVVLTGSPMDKPLQFDHPQVIPGAGEIPLRIVFALAKQADLVVGPESALTNAAGCWETPKICLLSHSTRDNLTKYWLNDLSLEPEDTPCYPCNQLHYSLGSCPTEEIAGKTYPRCAASGISPERLLAQLDLAYTRWQQVRSAKLGLYESGRFLVPQPN